MSGSARPGQAELVETGVLDFPATIAELPFFASGRFPKPDLLGRCHAGGIDHTSGRQLVERVRDVSLGLTSLGMARGDRVIILSESRPEWLLADFAILTAGAVTTPIYTTLSADQVGFILRDSGATLAIVSTPAQAAKLVSASQGSSIRTIVIMDLPAEPVAPPEFRVLSFAELAELGHRQIRDGWGVARAFRDQARTVKADDLATIIYTSGTTGDPKGVMLTHGNLTANVRGVLDVLDIHQEDVALSFLPLCHAFERIVAYVCLSSGASMIFAETMDTLVRDFGTVRPTVMSAVPRVFEKLYARVMERGAALPGPRRTVFNWAVRIARIRGGRLPKGQPLPTLVRLVSGAADALVYSQMRAAVGGRLRWAVSGSAPLDIPIAEFLYGIGLPILEGYGLTETSPVLCVMPLSKIRFGTVGPPLKNVELRIADDGEVLARGPNVMAGYYRRPESTTQAIRGGWFYTGDIGSLDDHGYLRISDRKKEIVVTSGGKKIAPQPIEQRLRTHALVAEAILIGDKRHFPAVLIVPEFSRLAARLGTDQSMLRANTGSDEVRAIYRDIIDGVNRDLAQFERIKKFALLSEELTVEGGALTPTLKVKRRVVEERYRDVIEDLYKPDRQA